MYIHASLFIILLIIKKESFILNVYLQSQISATAQINNLIQHNRRKEIHRTKTHDFVAPHNVIGKCCKGANEHIYLFVFSLASLSEYEICMSCEIPREVSCYFMPINKLLTCHVNKKSN